MRTLISTGCVLMMLHSVNSFAQCKLTESMTPGTHYKPVNVLQVNTGKGFTVNGYVRAQGDCKPVPGAKVAHWQTSSKGKYEDHLRAYMLTDRNGYYSFHTERPGGETPRIHFMIIANGYKTLITQWVGPGGNLNRIQQNFIVAPAGRNGAPR